MVHVPFDPRTVPYFYQQGEGIDTEGNGNGGMISEPYHYFIGMKPYQRGYGGIQYGAGIGDVLRGL